MVSAIARSAGSVKNAWWPVMTTFGNVSSRAKTSSAMISLEWSREKAVLLLVNVQADAAETAGLERLDDVARVDQRAAAGVHEQRAGAHQREPLGAGSGGASRR